MTKDQSLLRLLSHLTKRFFQYNLFTKVRKIKAFPKWIFQKILFQCRRNKHCSNEKESWKFLKNIILPYILNVCQIQVFKSQKALLVYGVFSGQTTDTFLDALKKIVIVTNVPPLPTIRFDGK